MLWKEWGTICNSSQRGSHVHSFSFHFLIFCNQFSRSVFLHNDATAISNVRSKHWGDFPRLQEFANVCSTPVVSNCGPPDVLGLQLPGSLASRGGGEGFWELKSKNIWRATVQHHWSKVLAPVKEAESWGRIYVHEKSIAWMKNHQSTDHPVRPLYPASEKGKEKEEQFLVDLQGLFFNFASCNNFKMYKFYFVSTSLDHSPTGWQHQLWKSWLLLSG